MATTRAYNKLSAQDLIATGVTSPIIDAISGSQAFYVGGILVCDDGIAIRAQAFALNPTVGNATLAAGTVTVNTTASSPTCQIFVSRTTKGTGNALGFLVAESKLAAGFTVNS